MGSSGFVGFVCPPGSYSFFGFCSSSLALSSRKQERVQSHLPHISAARQWVSSRGSFGENPTRNLDYSNDKSRMKGLSFCVQHLVSGPRSLRLPCVCGVNQ